MKIEVMKWTDHKVGVVLCAVMTLWDRLWRLVTLDSARRSAAAHLPLKPKRILFLKPTEMGTSVLLYPTLLRAKELYPDAELYFMAFRENIPILSLLEKAQPLHIIALRTKNFFLFVWDNLAALLKIRRLRIDVVIDLEFFSRYSALFSYLTGAGTRVGFHRFYSEGLYRGNLQTHAVPYNPYLHLSQSFMVLLLALQEAPGRLTLFQNIEIDKATVPKLAFSPVDIQKIWDRLKAKAPALQTDRHKLVLISPNTGEWLPFRNWPIEYFESLIRKILAHDPGVYIVITGTGSARQSASYLRNCIDSDRILDLTGQTSFYELLQLMSISKLLIASDSGPTHFACLTEIGGIISIFGPETDKVFGPLSSRAVNLNAGLSCHPCFSVFNSRTTNCSYAQKPCLTQVTPEQVFEKAQALL